MCADKIGITNHLYLEVWYIYNTYVKKYACVYVGLNPITVGNFAFLFNCTPVSRTSDSMMVPT